MNYSLLDEAEMEGAEDEEEEESQLSCKLWTSSSLTPAAMAGR